MVVPRGDRSGQIIEPLPDSDQWVRENGHSRQDRAGKPLSPAIYEFVPANWINTYRHGDGKPPGLVYSHGQLWVGPSHSRLVRYRSRAILSTSVAMKPMQEPGNGLTDDVAAQTGRRCRRNLVFISSLGPLDPFSGLAWHPERMKAEGFDRYLPSSVLIHRLRHPPSSWSSARMVMYDRFSFSPARCPFRTGLHHRPDSRPPATGRRCPSPRAMCSTPIDLLFRRHRTRCARLTSAPPA